MPLGALLTHRRILVCVGAGGVGKTTTAAALALQAARAGRKTLVLTIDPARRLAASLGLSELGHEERRIPDALLAAAGVDGPVPLWAMMLDVRRTFDEMVDRFAPDEETRARLRENVIYQQIAGRLAGSHEYAAMEKLHAIASEGRYDLIVLDTPPSESALDFLDAPRRMSDAIDSPALQWLVRPYLAAGRLSLKLLGKGSSFLLRQVGHFTGSRFLEDIARFLVEFNVLLGGFRTHAGGVEALLRDPGVGFVVVTTADPQTVDESVALAARLSQSSLSIDGIVVNRVRIPRGAPPDLAPRLAELARASGLGDAADEAAAALASTVAEQEQLARMDAVEIDRLRSACPAPPLSRVPLGARDVHDLRALDAVGRTIVSG